MHDRFFILETLRTIGAPTISAAQEAAIMAAPDVAEPVMDDVDLAFHRRAIVAETLKLFGCEELMWRGVYSDVFKACKNINEGLEATIAAGFIADSQAERRAFG